MEGLKVTIYLAGIISHVNYCVGSVSTVTQQAPVMGRCTNFSALTLLSFQTAPSLCFTLISNPPPPPTRWLSCSQKTQHTEGNLCATATWKQISNLVCTCSEVNSCSNRASSLWWLLNYSLILTGINEEPLQLLGINVYLFLSFLFFFSPTRKEAVTSSGCLRGIKNKSNCDWFNSRC